MSNNSDPRNELLQIIGNEPGLHFRAIQRKSGMAVGQLEYHLYKLEKDEEIVVRRDGRYKRYFLFASASQYKKMLGLNLRSKKSRDVIMLLLRKGTVKIENINKKIGTSNDVSEVIDLLITDGIVIKESDEISLRNPVSVRQFIKESRKSFLEELTDSFIDLLDEE